jgi:hypothetical protein
MSFDPNAAAAIRSAVVQAGLPPANMGPAVVLPPVAQGAVGTAAAPPSEPTTTPFATVDEAVLSAKGNWRTAVTNVAKHLVANEEGLSSGEIARFLRMVDPNLRFAVGAVGEYLRDNYFGGNIGLYDDPDTGCGTIPCQVARQTEGLFPDRTPANLDVMVYHRTADLARDHDFEVFVPFPGQAHADVANRDANPAPAQAPQPRTPSTVSVHLPDVAVKGDNRLYIPRKVVDAYCALGNVIDGNTQVFVAFESGYAQVAFEDNGGTEYNIWQGTGRIAFYPGDGVSWTPGDTFPVKVDNEGIHVKLS